ncbi:transcriptional regulator [Gordonibacter sp. An230]|uniref:helix-turn-helix domain-containing protein n=1 Tax=Gordonibacter sp. An230 TaxID=1965592 RepID=UPI000B373BCE|nr:helix-turn-helix transcriptional regulator [Gordonibacter sp. An230]OUO90174.1 transcriptional regulator [Gordonibacter sp. An230]
MSLILRLDRVMADRKMPLGRLAKKIDIAPANLSRIKTGKIKAVRFSTLEALCKELHCQPGDLIEYVPDGVSDEGGSRRGSSSKTE